MEQNSKNIFNNNQNQYSDSDEFSIDSMDPTNNINNINNINDNKYNQNSEKASSNKINNDIIEINEDKELNVSDEINDNKRLFMKEYKKFFITYIFKKHIASEVDKVINDYIENYNSKNDNFINLECK